MMTGSPERSEEPSQVGRFFRHSGIYALGSALNRVGAFLLLPVYTQFLTVAEYGVLEIYYAVAAVVAGILSVGISHATLRFYFEYESDDERNRLVSTNLIAALTISLAGVLLLACVGAVPLEKLLPSFKTDLAFRLVLATLVFELGSQVCLAYLRALEKSVLYISVALAKVVVQVILNATLLLWFDAGVPGVLAGNLATVLFGFLFLAGYTVRQCGLRFDYRYLMPVLRYSLPFLFGTVLAVVAANVDRFMIGGLLALEALGIFALAARFAALIGELVGEPFNRAYGAFRFTVMGHPNAARLQADIMRYLLVLLAAAGMGVIYFAGDVIRLLADQAYWEAAALLPWLVGAAVLNVSAYPLQTGILVRKATGELFYISLAQTVVRLGAAYLLIVGFGLKGACAAVLLDAGVGVVLTHLASQRYFPVRYDSRRLAMLVALAVAFYVAAMPVLEAQELGGFLARAGLYLAFVAALWWSPVISQSERAYTCAALKRLSGFRRAAGQA